MRRSRNQPPMHPPPEIPETPQILTQAETAHGVILQDRQDVIGALDLPGIDRAILCVHIGPSAKLSCRRDGRRYDGTAVHGDVDLIPAFTPSRWLAHDHNDRNL